MAFERVMKKGGMCGIDVNHISINSYGMTLGENASKLITTGFVELYLDIEGNRVGIKPTDSRINGYKITPAKQNPVTKCISGTWASRLSRGIRGFEVVGDMIVMNGVEIAPMIKKIQLPIDDGILREL